MKFIDQHFEEISATLIMLSLLGMFASAIIMPSLWNYSSADIDDPLAETHARMMADDVRYTTWLARVEHICRVEYSDSLDLNRSGRPDCLAFVDMPAKLQHARKTR